jgi:hypothetical protein
LSALSRVAATTAETLDSWDLFLQVKLEKQIAVVQMD